MKVTIDGLACIHIHVNAKGMSTWSIERIQKFFRGLAMMREALNAGESSSDTESPPAS